MHYSTNQKNIDRQERKGVLKNKTGVTGAKANIQKGNINIYIYIYIYIYIFRNLVETVNPTMYMMTNIYTQ